MIVLWVCKNGVLMCLHVFNKDDDCGYVRCKGNFENDMRNQHESNCTTYERYESCLNQIRIDCLAYQSDINSAKQAVATLILDDCTTTGM